LTDKTLAELGAIDAQQAPWTPGTRSD
jgi:hypothetical protein